MAAAHCLAAFTPHASGRYAGICLWPHTIVSICYFMCIMPPYASCFGEFAVAAHDAGRWRCGAGVGQHIVRAIHALCGTGLLVTQACALHMMTITPSLVLCSVHRLHTTSTSCCTCFSPNLTVVTLHHKQPVNCTQSTGCCTCHCRRYIVVGHDVWVAEIVATAARLFPGRIPPPLLPAPTALVYAVSPAMGVPRDVVRCVPQCMVGASRRYHVIN